MNGFAEAATALVAVGRRLDARGWAPATSGNYSARLVDGTIAITASGRHKGRMTPRDILRLRADGTWDGAGRPSAETALHLAIYRAFADAGAVLHAHSPVSVGLSRALPTNKLVLAAHEMLKALPGRTTHETRVYVPIVENAQEMALIEAAVMPRVVLPDAAPAYLIRGHGLYAWGRDVDEAERVLEAIEWMIAAELAERQFRGAAA